MTWHDMTNITVEPPEHLQQLGYQNNSKYSKFLHYYTRYPYKCVSEC